jgi:8-oxo-dGTP diphosphatase
MQITDVTAAVIITNGKVLIAQRRDDGSPRSGKWEFPGGKVEKGETLNECIIRELEEELSIQAAPGHILTDVIHHYNDRSVHLHAIKINNYDGEMKPNSHQKLQWVTAQELSTYDLSEADIPIAEFIRKA